jgi:hypothetical protein
MAEAVKELTAKGIPLEAIDERMVAEYLLSSHRDELKELTSIEATAS